MTMTFNRGKAVWNYQQNILEKRMTIFIKAKLRKSDDQTNIDKYRSELIFLRTIFPEFMMIRLLFNVKMYVQISKINICILFGHNYRVATLSTLYLTVLRINIPNLKSIGLF